MFICTTELAPEQLFRAAHCEAANTLAVVLSSVAFGGARRVVSAAAGRCPPRSRAAAAETWAAAQTRLPDAQLFWSLLIPGTPRSAAKRS